MTVKLDLPYLMPDKDRHGNPRLRVRVKVNGRARKITIKETPGTPEFMEAYAAAVRRLKAGEIPERSARTIVAGPAPDTLGWLAARYFGSPEFQALDRKSQRVRRSIIEACLREPLKPGSRLTMRDCPYIRIDATHILMLRDRRADKPGAANNRLKYLGAMFSWAIERGVYKIGSNPCRDVKRIRYVSSGFYTWTVDDVQKYVERHQPGTMAYLAFALMLFLGARRGDAIRLGPKNMRDGVMRYVPRKTAYTRVDESAKPVLPPLADAIKRTPTGLTTFLVTTHGKPFTDAGFGNKMREWCDEAGLPECSAHGLKKIAATICAELGATDRMLMALFDWQSEKLANVYTARANRSKLAAEAAKLLGAMAWAPIKNASEAV